MLQLMSPKSTGSATLLGGVRFTRDPENEETFNVYTKLRFPIDNEEDAASWEGSAEAPIFPGLSTFYRHARAEQNNAKWRLVLADDREFLVELFPKADDATGYRGGMVVSQVKATLSKVFSTVDLSIRVGGVEAHEVQAVVEMLRGLVDVTTENRQQALPLKAVK